MVLYHIPPDLSPLLHGVSTAEKGRPKAKLWGGFSYEQSAGAAAIVAAAIIAAAVIVAAAATATVIAAAGTATAAAANDQQQNDNPAAVSSTKSIITAHISGPPMKYWPPKRSHSILCNPTHMVQHFFS